MGDPELEGLRALAEAAARAAGHLLREGLTVDRLEIGTKTTGTDMVTEMDRASEVLIERHLLGARPDDGILGEEGADRQGTSGVRWVVDPLDGTTNYLYDFPGFNVSIAAELDGEVVAGAVYDVARDELFSAHLGGGATRDGTSIAPAPTVDLAQALVGTGFSYDPERRRRQAEVLLTVLPSVRDIRRQGAAAIDLCSVACGRLDAFYERGLAPWDLAAGSLVATEAGAIVTDLHGLPARADAVLASTPGIAFALLDLLGTTDAATA